MNEKPGRWSDLGLFAVIAAIVIAVWYSAWTWIDRNVVSPDVKVQSHESMRGTFGDKFGAVNALFSGLAFAGIIFTILLQRRELALQRSDIEEQNETLRQQRFENSFFHLLTLQRDIVAKLNVNGYREREAFTYFIGVLRASSTAFASFRPLSKLETPELHELIATRELSDAMQSKLDTGEISTLLSMLDAEPGCVSQYMSTDHAFHWKLIDAAYLFAHERSNYGLAHYFRNLYHVYRFIDSAEKLTAEEKRKYARIVRAQLSDEEQVAILYNALARGDNAHHEFGYPKMMKYVRDYDVLQNISPKSVLHPIHLQIANTCPLVTT